MKNYYGRIGDAIEEGDRQTLELVLNEAKKEFDEHSEVYKGIQEFAEVNMWLEDA